MDYLVFQYVEYYHLERPHQSLGNEVILKLLDEKPPDDLAGCHSQVCLRGTNQPPTHDFQMAFALYQLSVRAEIAMLQ